MEGPIHPEKGADREDSQAYCQHTPAGGEERSLVGSLFR